MLEYKSTYPYKKDAGILCFQYEIGEMWFALFLNAAHDSHFLMFKFGT